MELSELKKQIEDDEVVENQEVIDDEPETLEAESPETEEEGDFELVLEGEEVEEKPDNPTPERAILYKLTKERHKRKKSDSELEKVKAELEQLKSSLQPTNADTEKADLSFPDLYSPEINGVKEKYDLAVSQYFAELRRREEDAKTQQVQTQEQTEQFLKQVEQQATTLANRMSTFASEHKIDSSKAGDALRDVVNKIDEVTGIESSGLYMLDRVGEGSERLAYFFATKPEKFNEFLSKLENDSTGIDSAIYLTRLTEKLKPKKVMRSKAPEPDEPVVGDGLSQAQKSLQAAYEKASSPQEIFELRQKARKAGVTLN